MKKKKLSTNSISLILGMLTIIFLSLFGLFCINASAEVNEAIKKSEVTKEGGETKEAEEPVTGIVLSAIVKDEEGNSSKGAKIQLFVWENSDWVEAALAKTDKDGNALFEDNILTNRCYKFVELKAGSSGKLPGESERIRFAYVDGSGMVRYSKSFNKDCSSLGDNPTAWPIPIVNK